MKPGNVGLDEECGDSLSAGGGIGFGEDDVDAGGGTVGDPGFGAVEDIVARYDRPDRRYWTAVHWMPAASEPAAGSVRQKAPRISPEARRRR